MTKQVYNGLKKHHGIINEYVVTCLEHPLQTTANMEKSIALILYIQWRHTKNIIQINMIEQLLVEFNLLQIPTQ